MKKDEIEKALNLIKIISNLNYFDVRRRNYRKFLKHTHDYCFNIAMWYDLYVVAEELRKYKKTWKFMLF